MMTAADWISDRRALIAAAPFTRLHAHEPGEDYGEDEAGFYVRRPLGDGTYDGLRFIPTDDLAAEQIERITDGVNSLPAALDALEAVLGLHVRAGYRGAFCLHCQSLNDGDWPCPTVAAITAALGIEVQS